MGSTLDEQVIEVLKMNMDGFASLAAEMLEFDPDFLYHHLSINQKAKFFIQKRRKLGDEKRKVIIKESEKLLEIDHIWWIQYPKWLENMVMIKKTNNK